jgi:hypothetical protein
MKILLCLCFNTLFLSLHEINAQILWATSKKSLKMSVDLVKKELLSIENNAEKTYFSAKDSVDFKLDSPKISILIHRDSIYHQVEENAYFMSGKTEMDEYISKKLSKNHKKKGVTVVIKITIESYGEMRQPHVLSTGGDEILANDLLKIVKAMKIWTPAKIFGFDVSSYYILTLRY